MTLHSYRAMSADGRVLRGTAQASGLAELESLLHRRGLELIHGEPAHRNHLRPWTRPRIPRRELIHFCFHLEQLLAAGVPLLDGLADLRDATAHPAMRQVILGLLESIENGLTLSEAAAQSPAAFDSAFCGLLRAGEQTGELAPILRQLADTLTRDDELRAHARKLAIYPLIVGAVLLAAISVAFVFVVPQLASLFRSTGQVLPLQTRILIGASTWITQHGWMLALAAPLAVGCASVAIASHPGLRLRFDLLRLRLPLIGPLHTKLAMARVASVLASLYGAGITVLDALRSAEIATANRALQESLAQARARIAAGQGIAGAFEESMLFPQLVIRMLRLGEQTGSLDTALANIVYFYERDARESIERLQAGAEPVLTLILGALMLWVVFAVLGPVYDIMTRLPV